MSAAAAVNQSSKAFLAMLAALPATTALAAVPVSPPASRDAAAPASAPVATVRWRWYGLVGVGGTVVDYLSGAVSSQVTESLSAEACRPLLVANLCIGAALLARIGDAPTVSQRGGAVRLDGVRSDEVGTGPTVRYTLSPGLELAATAAALRSEREGTFAGAPVHGRAAWGATLIPEMVKGWRVGRRLTLGIAAQVWVAALRANGSGSIEVGGVVGLAAAN